MVNISILYKRFWPFIAIFILVIPVIIPLFHNGFFTMHDDEQIARLYELDQSVRAMDIPPRWVSHLGFGFGYPLFNFYPPLVYYFGEFFHLLGFSFINATKIVMGLGFFLSGIFMFLWVKKYAGILGGIVAATLYVYAPYHGVDLYVRGAFAEFFSFVWIPAVFWSMDKVTEKKNTKWVVISSMLLAFVVLTHNLIALPFVFFLIMYSLRILLGERNQIKILLPLFALIGFLALGLTAYFWLPALVEKQYTLVDTILTKELANYTIHFVYLNQLWNSPWGYGGSAAGLNDGLSFQVGKFQLLLPFLTVLVSIYFFVRKRDKRTLFFISIFSLFLFSLFMTTAFSKFLWDIFQPLAYLQFPWRFLEFSAVFSSFLGGVSIVFFKKFLKEKITLFIGISIIVGSIFLIVRFFHPSEYLSNSDKDYIVNQDIEWRVSKMSFEYVPKGVATYISPLGITQLAIEQKDIPISSFQIQKGDMTVLEKVNAPSYKQYATSGLGGVLTINTYMFPGWSVYIDGKKENITKFGMLQLISFPVSSGAHVVEVVFENTPIRVAGNVVSILSLCLLFMLFFYSFAQNNVIIKGMKRTYFGSFFS